MKKIALVINTEGLEYDDRIRKEIRSIMKLYPDIKFKIFAIITSKNEEKSGTTDYGVDFYIPYLTTRDKYPSGSHLLTKAYDFFKTVNPLLKDYDAVWCADRHVFMFLLLCNKPMVWDLHELPTELLGNCIKKFLLKYMMRRCKAVIHANPERMAYLKKVNALSNLKNQLVLRNYPCFNESDKYTDNLFEEFVKWKNGDDCVYLQGLDSYDRCDRESVVSVLSVNGLKAVIVGNFRNELKQELFCLYGNELKHRLFFTGKVRQQMTPLYIQQCKFALVLYRNVRANNFYCEPNRMYQTIVNGLPVVVGCNPPMKELVEKHGFGIVLEGDGSDSCQIENGIRVLLKGYDQYVKNVNKYKDVLRWEYQEDVIKESIAKLFAVNQ